MVRMNEEQNMPNRSPVNGLHGASLDFSGIPLWFEIFFLRNFTLARNPYYRGGPTKLNPGSCSHDQV